VVGYDLDASQIREANVREGHRATFMVARPLTFMYSSQFDAAVAVNVLMHAQDDEELRSFFANTYAHLRPDGLFVAIIHNPAYKRVGETCYQRTLRSINETEKVIDFLLPNGVIVGTATIRAFTKKNYETAAHVAGFEPLIWYPVQIDAQARERDPAFWRGFEDDCPYIAFFARKMI
jgi:SAM-dependent methyltransferase